MNDMKPAVSSAVLNADSNAGYGRLPIPNPRDEEIDRLLRESIKKKLLSQLIESLDDGSRAVLRVFAERRATAAVRDREPAHLFIATVALCLSCTRDSREALAIMPLPIHAANEIHCDMRHIAEGVRVAIGDVLTRPFLEFLMRAPADQSIAAMGYAVGADADGFRYVREW